MNAEFLALYILILVFSVVLHEVMHGLAALWNGDHTAEHAGRLTLNPISHIDPVWSILIPAVSIFTGAPALAAAKPVPINPLNFHDIKKGEITVSLAGIGANFALAILGAIGYHFVTFSPLLQYGLFQTLVRVNLFLGVLNLLPILPLDGSKVLLAFLPYEYARQFERFSIYGFLILFVLLYLGWLSLLLFSITIPLSNLLGVPLF